MKNKKYKIKALAVLIVVSMLLTVMPQSAAVAFAEDSTDPFEDAISTAQNVSSELETLYQSVKDVPGFGEVTKLVEQARDEINRKVIALNDMVTYTASAKNKEVDSSYEEEQLRIAREQFLSFADEAGDPSGFVRDLNVITADSNAAIGDMKYAAEKSDYRTAYRAFLELVDVEETLLNSWEAGGADSSTGRFTKEDIIKGHDNMIMKKNALAEKQKNSLADVDKAKAAFEIVKNTQWPAYGYLSDAVDLTEDLISSAGTEDAQQYNEKLALIKAAKSSVNDLDNKLYRLDFSMDSAWYRLMEEVDRLSAFEKLDEARQAAADLLFPTFFVSANELTYNGQSQKLVTLSPYLTEKMSEDPNKQSKYSIGDAPGHVPADLVYSADPADLVKQEWGTDYPDISEMDTSIPERTEPGTYYVYFHWDEFSSDEFITIKVTIRKAVPSYKIPKGLTAVYGQKLSDVKLPKADNGRWEWVSKSKSAGKIGTNYFKARFIPNDPEHYDTVSDIKVPVKVKAKESATPSVLKTKGKTAITIAWIKVEGADGYEIYFAKCKKNDTKANCKKVKTIKGNKTFTWTKKKLKKETAYKAYVKAYANANGKKTYINTSPLMHLFTSGGNKGYTNAKAVTVNKTRVTLNKGKTFKLKAKAVKQNKKKKLMPKSHVAAVRYLSTNKKIAAVSGSGKITAKGTGTCYVYAYAHNGVNKKIKVTVK